MNYECVIQTVLQPMKYFTLVSIDLLFTQPECVLILIPTAYLFVYILFSVHCSSAIHPHSVFVCVCVGWVGAWVEGCWGGYTVFMLSVHMSIRYILVFEWVVSNKHYLLSFHFCIQSTLVISKSKGLYEILRDIRTSTYQICRTGENN